MFYKKLGILFLILNNIFLTTCKKPGYVPDSKTVPDAPTIGTATSGNGQAIVTFTAPASNGGSAITGYTVTSSPGGLTGSGSVSPITVTGLTNGTAYTFTVTASNAKGTSLASSASNSVTPSTVPGAPTNVSATEGNGQATVTFEEPANNGSSTITGYTVTSSPGGITATGSASPITVTGLTNGNYYYFTVTATNANGTGPASSASFMVVPGTVPDAPTNVSATAGNGQAIVTFTPGFPNYSRIIGYFVTSNPGGITAIRDHSPITVTGLTNGIAYTFTVTASNHFGTGPASSASNSVTPLSTLISDIEDNVYKTVIIGSQTWMAENLKTTRYNDGTFIPNVTDNASWAALTSSAYCWYSNDASYKTAYGALYNWYVVDAASNGGKNVCPTGWHVPTDAEWTTLTTYLGGENVTGGKLKETGTTHWYTPNPATNETGFTALPGGYRDVSGVSYNFAYIGYWWSYTEYSTTSAWYRHLYYDNAGVYRDYYNKRNGISIRCLKD